MVNQIELKERQIKLEDVQKDSQSDIPWIVRLLENPASPLPFPGQIDLDNHDELHIILNRGVTTKDEAFVVGFTMGIDKRTKRYHLFIFRLFAQYLYPKKFRMDNEDWIVFKLGFYHGTKYNSCTSLDSLKKQIKRKDLDAVTEVETFLCA